MKAGTRTIGALVLLVGLVGLTGCGKPLGPEDESANSAGEVESGTLKVKGSASFGAHCPFGTFQPPMPVPLEAFECPVPRQELELVEDFQPFVFMIDCKKRTMDIRGVAREHGATSWEFMPDGSFRFDVDAGFAKIKNDGFGNSNCAVPVKASLWGMVDCTDRDNAKVKIETVWFPGQTSAPRPSPSPSPSSSVRPSPTPTSTARPTPVPSVNPAPRVSVTPQPPAGTPRPTPSVIVAPVPPRASPGPTPNNPTFATPDSAPRTLPSGYSGCQLPPGCYFHNITHFNQCG